MLRVREFPSTILLQVKDNVIWDTAQSLALAQRLNEDLLRDAATWRFDRTVHRERDDDDDMDGYDGGGGGGDVDVDTNAVDDDLATYDDAWRRETPPSRGSSSKTAMCPRTHCPCGAGEGHMALSSEPCRRVQKADEEAVLVGRTRVLQRMPLIGWRAGLARFVEFHLARPCYARAAKRLLERYVDEFKWTLCEPANVIPDAVLALLHASDALDRVGTVETGMTGLTAGAWVTWGDVDGAPAVGGGTYAPTAFERVSTCDAEYVVPFSRLGVEQRDAAITNRTAPLRRVCYDIECATRDGRFPDAQHDAVLMVALVWQELHATTTTPRRSVVLTWGRPVTTPLRRDGECVVLVDERAMLVELCRELREGRPDILAGHNSDGFDFPYLAQRCAVLGLAEEHWNTWTCVPRENVTHLCTTRTSNQRGTERATFYRFPGVVALDSMQLAKTWKNYPSYSLDYLSHEELGDALAKEDVPHTMITPLWEGSAEDRAVLVNYNLVDALCVDMLLDKWQAVDTLLSEAKVAGVLLRHRVGHGLQMRITRLLQQYMRPAGYVLPAHRRVYDDDANDAGERTSRTVVPLYVGVPPPADSSDVSSSPTTTTVSTTKPVTTTTNTRGKSLLAAAATATTSSRDGKTKKGGGGGGGRARKPGFRGAVVLTPKVGYYLDEIISFDFASLYPSLIRSWNLSWDVWVRDPATYVNAAAGRTMNDLRRSAVGYWFLKTSVREGLLARVVRRLLDGRALAKQAMKAASKAGDATMAAVFNLRQGALKVMANSAYGALGASSGPLFFPMGATSVTGEGRRWIMETKAFVETPRRFAGLGFGDGLTCEVLYGDTDSLMIKLSYENETAERTMELGEAMVNLVNESLFKGTAMSLAFECRYSPYLIMAPKMYATYKFEAGKLDRPTVHEKGTVGVRRDNARIVSHTERHVMQLLMKGTGDGDGAHKRTRTEEYAHREEAAWTYVREAVERLYRGDVPFEDLVITQALRKELEAYDNPNAPALAVTRRWRRERPVDAPQTGDRVRYYIAHDPGHRVGDKARPIYCREQGEGPDYEFYVRQKLMNPIKRIFNVVNPARDVDALFDPRNYRVVRTINGFTKTVAPSSSSSLATTKSPTTQRTLAAFLKRVVNNNNDGDGDNDDRTALAKRFQQFVVPQP